jgi:hypothetical protein
LPGRAVKIKVLRAKPGLKTAMISVALVDGCNAGLGE